MRNRLTALLGAIALAGLTAACAQTDAGITTSVKSRLAADDTVKAYAIDVDTREGVVTLTGTVETTAAKEQAVQVARGTEGVVNVVDNITVSGDMAPTSGIDDAAGAAGGAATDAALTAAVKSKLLADTTVSGLSLDVDTNNGVVTLTGKVRSEAERARALELARETDGVTSVVDKMTMGG
jgi:hyperosmotically inducible protein